MTIYNIESLFDEVAEELASHGEGFELGEAARARGGELQQDARAGRGEGSLPWQAGECLVIGLGCYRAMGI